MGAFFPLTFGKFSSIIIEKEAVMHYYSRRFIPVVFVIFFFSINLFSQSQYVVRDDFRVNDDTTGNDNYIPVVTLSKNGNGIVVWQDGRNGASNIYGQVYDSLGIPSGPNFKVSQNTGSIYENFPSAAHYGDSILVFFQPGYGQWLLNDGTQSGPTIYFHTYMIAPDVAVGDSGIFVVWQNIVSGSGYEVFFQRFTFAGDSIGSRIIVNDDGGSSNQQLPKIDIAANGKIIVVWEDYRGGNWDVYAQLFDAGGNKIGSNFIVNDSTVNGQDQPECSMDYNGDFIVVWNDYRSGNKDIYGQLYDSNGTPIGNNFLINDDGGAYYQNNVSCSMDSAGNFVVVWEDLRDGQSHIYGQIFDPSGAPIGANIRLDENTGPGYQYNPSVSTNGNQFIIAWEDSRDDRSIYTRRFAMDGTPATDEAEVNDLNGTRSQRYPSVDMNINGNGVIVWEDLREPQGIYFEMINSDGDTTGRNKCVGTTYGYTDVFVKNSGNFIITYSNNQNIYFRMYTSTGDTIGPAKIASDTIYGPRGNPTIDADSANNFVISWYDYRNGNNDIYAQRFTPSGDTIGTNFLVNDDVGTANQFSPDVCVSPGGEFLIVWYDYRNGNYDIYGQLYDATGTPIGTNFLINDDGGTQNQSYPRAGVLPDGRFIVVWQDYRSPSGIYGQIIDSNGSLMGTNFMISEGYGWYPSIAVNPNGGYVVTWYDSRGFGYDIYAQKFKPDLSPDSVNYKVNNDVEGINYNQDFPAVATDGNNIVFVWRDAKWQRGYDIAAKVVNWAFSSVDKEITEGDIYLMLKSSNPITGPFLIQYSIDMTTDVDISIYNLVGRRIKTLVKGRVKNGTHQVQWNPDNIPTGLYFCRMNAGGKTNSVKILYVK